MRKLISSEVFKNVKFSGIPLNLSGEGDVTYPVKSASDSEYVLLNPKA